MNNGLLRSLEHRDRLFLGYGWKVGQERVQRIASLKVVEQVLERDPRAREYWHASLDFRVSSNENFGHG